MYIIAKEIIKNNDSKSVLLSWWHVHYCQRNRRDNNTKDVLLKTKLDQSLLSMEGMEMCDIIYLACYYKKEKIVHLNEINSMEKRDAQLTTCFHVEAGYTALIDFFL